MTAFDIVMEERKKLTEEIIKGLEKDGLKWMKTWQDITFPINASNSTRYNGGNALKLTVEMIKNNYKDPRFITFIQAQNNNWKIKKGAQGIICEHWKFTKKEKIIENGEEKEIEKKLNKPIVSYFKVFNANDVEGIPPYTNEVKKLTTFEYKNVINTLKESSKCAIQEIPQNEAFYSQTKDIIVLPPKENFKTEVGYISTLIHEMAHSTGHVDRLNRKNGEFASPEYAQEELRAEISSIFLKKALNIVETEGHINNHQAYINSWIQLLKKDSSEIYRASSKAEEISNYLYKNYIEKEKSQEIPKNIENKFLKRERENSLER